MALVYFSNLYNFLSGLHVQLLADSALRFIELFTFLVLNLLIIDDTVYQELRNSYLHLYKHNGAEYSDQLQILYINFCCFSIWTIIT